MKQKAKLKGVKLKMWEYFCMFAIQLLVVIWLLQVVFLQYYYIGAMAKETLGNARQLVRLYKENKLDEETVRNNAYKNNLSIVITDKNGNVISASDAMGVMDHSSVIRLNMYGQSIGNLKEAIAKSAQGEVYYRLENDDTKSKVLFYAAFTQEGVEPGGSYIYVMSQIEPIDSVISVMQGQFIIITIISLVVALTFAYLIALKFSRPVEKLTESARELALGNTDVTFKTDEAFGEIAELSSALNYAASEIIKSNQLRRELMANVSHDLRTPLTMIKMYAEMIRDISGDNKEKREKNLKIIIDETDRLSLLVNDILDLSKIESSQDLELENFDICQMIQSILERFSVMTQQGYTFSVEAPEALTVRGDVSRIQQVIYNLLGNAINYTGEDKKVMIRVTRKEKTAKVEIIDTGNGIPKEELANVWDRYYRAKTHVRSKIGTGLGLSIVKSILIAHNADFGIESTLGVGSNFWFELKIPEFSDHKKMLLANNNTVTEKESDSLSKNQDT